jgi:hypothetical protein
MGLSLNDKAVIREYRKLSLRSALKLISGTGAEIGHLSGIGEVG